jgi:hypothetical protein
VGGDGSPGPDGAKRRHHASDPLGVPASIARKSIEEALARCLVWLMAPELGIRPFVVSSRPEAGAHERIVTGAPALAWVPIKQPFAIGNRVIVVANQHDQRETLDGVGHTGRVCQVYPYPIDHVMDGGVMLDDESMPRSFPPSALARLDPEADDWEDD